MAKKKITEVDYKPYCRLKFTVSRLQEGDTNYANAKKALTKEENKIKKDIGKENWKFLEPIINGYYKETYGGK